MASDKQPGKQVEFSPKRAYIVSHTHWDREWYLAYHTFRVNFTRVVQQILAALENEPEFKHFLLDGQTAILEDYLEIHPEDAGRINGLVRRGKLSLGPWYILPDEFLVSAEAHVRNLVYGHKVAAAHGGVQKVGYMPDSFGHIAQMPQILRGAGIGSFIFTRGSGDEIDRTGFEFQWVAPDGSSVLAVNQCGGYCNAAGLGFEEIWHAHTRREVSLGLAVQQIRELFTKFRERSNGDLVLLNNGCDHFPPQQEFASVVEALRSSFPDTEFIHTELAEYVSAVDEAGISAQEYCGELTGGKLHHILSGVWSARIPLKQQNDAAQSWLTDYLEPLSAFTHFMYGQAYPGGLLEYAWKLLLKNHPHDSICGCSIDEVHREMLPRFTGVIETAEQECMRQLEELAPTFARQPEADRDTVLCVFNPLPWERDAVIERLVVLQPQGYGLDALKLLDGQGCEVPFRITKKWYVERFWGVDYRTMFDTEQQLEKLTGYLDSFEQRFLKSEAEKDSADCFLLIEFVAKNLPAVGHTNYRLTDRQPEATRGTAAAAADIVMVEGNMLENKFVQVAVQQNGSFDLTCKATGNTYTGLNLLESTEDTGDEYDYCPAANSTTLSTADVVGEIDVLRSGVVQGTLAVRFDWQLPASINDMRTTRSSELKHCHIEVRISLSIDSPIVDVDVLFDNQACDHRLRALLPTSIETNSLISHGHFFLNERPIVPPVKDGWVQPHPGTYPQQDFSLVEGDAGGLAVLNRGLPEVAPLNSGQGGAGIALTLLRSVGWLSRDDFPTRNNSNAGPTIPTPEAQCLGQQRFHYAVMPYAGCHTGGEVLRRNAQWRTPPLVIQGVEDQAVAGGVSFLKAVGPAVVTAIKHCEEHDTLVVRMYNPLPEQAMEVLQCVCKITSGWLVNLLEERVSELPASTSASPGMESGIVGNRVYLTLGAHEIVTIELELGHQH